MSTCTMETEHEHESTRFGDHRVVREYRASRGAGARKPTMVPTRVSPDEYFYGRGGPACLAGAVAIDQGAALLFESPEVDGTLATAACGPVFRDVAWRRSQGIPPLVSEVEVGSGQLEEVETSKRKRFSLLPNWSESVTKAARRLSRLWSGDSGYHSPAVEVPQPQSQVERPESILGREVSDSQQLLPNGQSSSTSPSRHSTFSEASESMVPLQRHYARYLRASSTPSERSVLSSDAYITTVAPASPPTTRRATIRTQYYAHEAITPPSPGPGSAENEVDAAVDDILEKALGGSARAANDEAREFVKHLTDRINHHLTTGDFSEAALDKHFASMDGNSGAPDDSNAMANFDEVSPGHRS